MELDITQLWQYINTFREITDDRVGKIITLIENIKSMFKFDHLHIVHLDTIKDKTYKQIIDEHDTHVTFNFMGIYNLDYTIIKDIRKTFTKISITSILTGTMDPTLRTLLNDLSRHISKQDTNNPTRQIMTDKPDTPVKPDTHVKLDNIIIALRKIATAYRKKHNLTMATRQLGTEKTSHDDDDNHLNNIQCCETVCKVIVCIVMCDCK